MFDPKVLVTYAVPIAVITVAVVVGKVLACSLGTFLAGHDGRTSLRVGMGLAQIGEFSFIIAALGLTLKVTSDFLYPIVVAVSAITTLLTPYLIKLADPLSAKAAKSMPQTMAKVFGRYTTWLESMQLEGDRAALAKIILRILLQVLVNCALVAAVFLAGAFFVASIEKTILAWISEEAVQKAIVWGGALIISLPFLIATYRKLKALSLLLAELGVRPDVAGRYTKGLRRSIAEVIPILSIAGILLLIGVLSVKILPPAQLLIVVFAVAAVLAALLWKPFVRLHSRLQIALFETLDEEPDKKHW
jgi:CPA2 family monovalent cation:H+ antiporter-2